MKILKDKRGASLIWVFVVFMIISVFMLFMQNTIVGANQRLKARVDRHQSLSYIQSIGDIFTKIILENGETGKSIISYLYISGDFSINEISGFEDVQNLSVDFSSHGQNNVSVYVSGEYNGFNSEYTINLLQKYILYDKDGNMITDDFQGSLTEEELEEYFLENYWVVDYYA